MNIALIIQYIAIAFLFFCLYTAVVQRPSKLQVHAILLSVFTMLMFIGYSIEIVSHNLEMAMLGASISYLGKPFVMLESLMLISEFFERRMSKVFYGSMVLVCSSFPVLLFTNSYHHLYYSMTAFEDSQPYSPLIVGHGPLYFTYVALVVFFFGFCCYIIISDIVRHRHMPVSHRRKSLTACSLIMIASGMTGYAVYLADLTNNYDSTMAGVFVGVLTLLLMFVRFKIFDVVTIAKANALDDASVGLCVFDESGKMTYTNAVADKLLKNEETKKSIFNLEDQNQVELDNRIYSLHRRVLTVDNSVVGSSVEITDITYAKNYQRELESTVKERTEKIENIQRVVIESFADIVESRSLETGDHVKRTSAYTRMIAEALREQDKYRDAISDDDIDLYSLASPLHDIGKISISDTILLKPGRLTAEEFEKMKEHSMNGAVLIEKTLSGVESDEFVAVAKLIARHHHERWDGTGYPDRLAGADIPLCARIVALADCFDALTTERCYKAAYTMPEAIGIIKEETGTHFDPDVVKAFLSALPN